MSTVVPFPSLGCYIARTKAGATRGEDLSVLIGGHRVSPSEGQLSDFCCQQNAGSFF